MKSVQPLNDNVLIKLMDTKEEKTSGGLYIPDTAREKPSEGEIAGISSGLDVPLKVGDLVLYKKFSGTETSLDGVDYIIVPMGDILAKIVQVDAIPE